MRNANIPSSPHIEILQIKNLETANQNAYLKGRYYVVGISLKMTRLHKSNGINSKRLEEK